jgi:hypothetical protein
VIGIKLANDVPIQRSHDADARHHRRTAKRSDQDQRLHCCLPFRCLVLGLRKPRDVGACVLQRDELPAARQRNGIIKTGRLGHLPVPHHWDGLFVPIEIGPHVSASLAAHLTDEPRFQVGQPDVIGPSVSADRD